MLHEVKVTKRFRVNSIWVLPGSRLAVSHLGTARGWEQKGLAERVQHSASQRVPKINPVADSGADVPSGDTGTSKKRTKSKPD